MESNNQKRREFTADPINPKQRAHEHRETDFLHVLAQGESINDACALVGVTRFACDQSNNREKKVRASIATSPRPQSGNPENPDNPDKTLPPQSTPKLMQNQQDTRIQTPTGAL